MESKDSEDLALQTNERNADGRPGRDGVAVGTPCCDYDDGWAWSITTEWQCQKVSLEPEAVVVSLGKHLLVPSAWLEVGDTVRLYPWASKPRRSAYRQHHWVSGFEQITFQGPLFCAYNDRLRRIPLGPDSILPSFPFF
jgi:hypothetical protein